MKCKRGGGRKKKMIWRWKEREIKKVKKYKYLGYVVLAGSRKSM